MLTWAKFDHFAYALMAWDEWWLWLDWPVAFGGVEVSVADAGGEHLDQCLVLTWLWEVNVVDIELGAKLVHNSGSEGRGEFSSRHRSQSFLIVPIFNRWQK